MPRFYFSYVRDRDIQIEYLDMYRTSADFSLECAPLVPPPPRELGRNVNPR